MSGGSVFSEFRRSFALQIEAALELLGFVLSLAGASLAAAFGRFLLALLLAAVAFGMGRRIVKRRQRFATKPKPAAWIRAVCLTLSLIEVAVLVEATDTPVRFHQEGFAYVHWAWVAAAIVVAYAIQVRALTALTKRARPAS
jgi:hypothetical protein